MKKIIKFVVIGGISLFLISSCNSAKKKMEIFNAKIHDASYKATPKECIEALKELSQLPEYENDNEIQFAIYYRMTYFERNPDRRIKYLNQAIKFSDKNPEPYFVRGFARSQIKDYDGALKDFDTAIALDPNSFNSFMTYVLRGNIMIEQEKENPNKKNTEIVFLQAGEYYKRALELNTGTSIPEYYYAKSKFELGNYFKEKNNLDKARANYYEAVKYYEKSTFYFPTYKDRASVKIALANIISDKDEKLKLKKEAEYDIEKSNGPIPNDYIESQFFK